MLLKQILSSLLAVIVVVLGSLFLAISVGYGRLSTRALTFIAGMEGSLEYIVIFATVVVIGLVYFSFNLKGKAEPNSILIPSELGEVRISLDSIDSLVHQAVKSVKGIKDLKTRIVLREGGLFIYVKAILYGDRNIPELSQQMQGVIGEHVFNISGVNVSEVKVLVENVATDIKARVS